MYVRPTPRRWGAGTDPHLQMPRTSGSPVQCPMRESDGRYPPSTIGRVNPGDATPFLSPERHRPKNGTTWTS